MFSSGGVGNMSSVNKFFFVLFGGTYGADGDTTGALVCVYECVCACVCVCECMYVCVWVCVWSAYVLAVWNALSALITSIRITHIYHLLRLFIPSSSFPFPIFISRES
jgi:hypothetical protein